MAEENEAAAGQAARWQTCSSTCHTRSMSNPCATDKTRTSLLKTRMNEGVCQMQWEDPGGIDLPPCLSFPLILYCVGQVTQSWSLQPNQAGPSRNVMPGMADSSLLVLSMTDLPHPPPLVQDNFLELKTLNPVKHKEALEKVLFCFFVVFRKQPLYHNPVWDP